MDDCEEKNAEDKVACGLYRTTLAMGAEILTDTLVYYHNHGNPGPGLYPVQKWRNNKAIFTERGATVVDHKYPQTLKALPTEGFYRVVEAFFCCEKNCTQFEADSLVQLGYNGAGQALLFRPSWSVAGVLLPDRGTRISDDKFVHLQALKMRFTSAPSEPEGSPIDDNGPTLDSTFH